MFFDKSKNQVPTVLSFDLELWHEGEWLKPYISPNPRDFLVESLEPILGWLKACNGRATFFVTRQVIEKYPDIVSDLSRCGHEVASHGPRHTRLANWKPDEFERELAIDSKKIFDLTGLTPKGFRAPHFSLTEDIEWLFPVLRRLGFQYDSSIFPVKTGSYGSGSFPFVPFYNSGLWELPVFIRSFKGWRIPAAGGFYFRLYPEFMFGWLISQSMSSDTWPVLYFHPHELCALTPKIRGPWLKTKLKYYGVDRSLEKLKRVLSGRQVVSMMEYINHLNKKNNL